MLQPRVKELVHGYFAENPEHDIADAAMDLELSLLDVHEAALVLLEEGKIEVAKNYKAS